MINIRNRASLAFLASTLALLSPVWPPSSASAGPDLTALAQSNLAVHRFSTLFTAQNVRDCLTTNGGIETAIAWCRQTAVSKIYLEVFRGDYLAERATLERARDAFRKAGFEVPGCVTTTRVGKPSTGWKEHIACYTDPPTQERLRSVFQYAASLFDEIMVDDFWFTDCACPECDQARQAGVVTIAGKTSPVTGDTWEDYRGELMLRLSEECLLNAAKKVNPKARLIIKYPQWYDQFHERGYDVARQTAAFDRIWVGTETRDYTDKRWGGTVQYEAYFIMRWLGGIGGAKCGGGWFDPLGTTERTYIEQARQTILGGARESFLFCYGNLQRDYGPQNIVALRANLPELFAVAKEVKGREIVGVATCKPANSHCEKEKKVFDFVGMLGLPLVPGHEFPTNAPAAFFSVHALKDAQFTGKLRAFIAAGKLVLLTDGLAQRLTNQVNLASAQVRILPVKGDPKSLLNLPQTQLDDLRAWLLRPLKTSFRAPDRVALYLFRGGSWVVENFNDQAVTVELNGKPLEIAARGWRYQWQ